MADLNMKKTALQLLVVNGILTQEEVERNGLETYKGEVDFVVLQLFGCEGLFNIGSCEISFLVNIYLSDSVEVGFLSDIIIKLAVYCD